MPLANFLASGVLLFEKKLGPFLWQFPPNFKYQKDLLENFFKLLPMDSATALNIARCHDERIKTDDGLEVSGQFSVRHAIEIRHQSFANDEFIGLLRQYNVGLVCADAPEWPRMMDLTSDFVYCRLHGAEALYENGYDDKSLDDWARRVTDWAQGREPKDAERIIDRAGLKRAARDVFVYFDNDLKVKAPTDAQGLAARVRKILKKKE
jgi:uncharacterized protein YecE (DUF72 family)